MTADVLNRWESVLSRLAEDPMLTSKELDWVAKLEILEGYRARDHLSWGHPRLQLVDLQYSDVRPERGLYNRLAARGRIAGSASPGAAEKVGERQEKLTDDVEAILDEIDEVLEENAEEFVRFYVQKGGESACPLCSGTPAAGPDGPLAAAPQGFALGRPSARTCKWRR